MTTKETLLTKLANFKKTCRRFAADCTHEEQEWVLDTCYSRINRLSAAGVANKHAGVKGMQALGEDEKDLTMMTMLELKGKGSKKQKEQHQGGKLVIKKAPFKYGRFADAIEARSGVFSRRSNAFATHDCQEHAHERPLLQVHCPNCGSHRTSKGLNLKKVSNFANLKCQSCNETSSTKNWACGCGEKWRTCTVHSICDTVLRVPSHRRQRHADPRGNDTPPPKWINWVLSGKHGY